MYKRILIIIIILSAIIPDMSGQDKNKSSGIDAGFITGFTYGYSVPGGDLAERFGANFKIGVAPVYYFYNSNFYIGLEGNYLFGSDVKENVISNLVLSDGNVLDIEGNFANPLYYERGIIAGAIAGKIIPFGAHKRTGLKLELGIMGMWHWISFQKERDKLPQLEGEYLKGYDRLTGGFAVKEQIAYQYLARKSKINFYIGVELYQAFSKNLRKYNYNTATTDTKNRKDFITGITAGWILPLYIVKHPEEIYY